MPKKRRKLDQYLNKRKQSHEAALTESTRVSNRLFRFCVGAVLTSALVLTVVWGRPLDYSLGIGVLIFFTVVLCSMSLNRIQPGIFEKPAAFNQFVLLTLLFFGLSAFVTVVMKAKLEDGTSFAGWSPFLIPLPFCAMMFAMAFSQGAALLIGCSLAAYVALTSPRQVEILNPLSWDSALGLVLAVGAVVSVLGMRRIRKQSRPVIIGFYAGLAQAVVLICILLPQINWKKIDDTEYLQGLMLMESSPIWGFAGGLLSGAVLTCLLPVVERILGVLTERRLLDLADPSNEVLRSLMERAQGTYQHSLGVSLLASGAAEGIGADSLLARVGAYYHDIGKMVKPQYFVENMGEDKSIHDRLRPSISKMIIISHVKEGIQLAKEASLPQKIVDMIPMHHGTTVVEFFYHKARKNRDPHEEHDPGEVEYRYPGPKPRFREAALLMLADSVEARAKVESHPNPNRFRVMVHEEIQKRLLDGQLNESGLTLNDLRVVEDSFVRTLTTMYHGRIKYPSFDDDKPSRGTNRESRHGRDSKSKSGGGTDGGRRGTDSEKKTTTTDVGVTGKEVPAAARAGARGG